MLRRVLQKLYHQFSQKLFSTHQRKFGNGFMEINPQYYDEMLVQANLVEYWIGQLDTHIARTQVKEQMYKEGIARCNYLIQEVLPLINTAMGLLKQSIDYNSRINQELTTGEPSLPSALYVPADPGMNLSDLSPDERLHFQNITLMLSDTFERLGEKRNKIRQWVSQARLETEMISEA